MWEVVRANGDNIKSDRQQVLGGWIVRTYKSNEYGVSKEQAFVSDPAHEWKVYKELNKSKKKVL